MKSVSVTNFSVDSVSVFVLGTDTDIVLLPIVNTALWPFYNTPPVAHSCEHINQNCGCSVRFYGRIYKCEIILVVQPIIHVTTNIVIF
jgi:hypothetical protein